MINQYEIDKLHNELKIVFLFLIKKGISQIEVEDIIQETAIRYVVNFDSIRGPHIRSWLFRVALNLHYDQHKKAKLTCVSIEDFLHLSDTEYDPVESFLEKELSIEIRDTISKLKPLHQKLLRLRYFFDCSYKEMASILDTDVEGVKRNLHRARKKFEQVYKRDMVKTV